VCGISSARYKNCVQQVIVQEPKLCAVDIGARHKSSAPVIGATEK
jgi:hypothetical protein